MRDIKFRAWDKAEKRMVLPENAIGWKIHFSGSVDYKGSWATGDLILMQYTGLKDKNGKEIYEGDVVVGEKGNYQCRVQGVVKYGGLAFAYVGKTDEGENWFDTITSPTWTTDSRIKVIGNIHENPELL